MELNILVFGRDKGILDVLERLINSHEGWKATTAASEEQVFSALREKEYRIVFVSAGIDPQEENELHRRIQQQYPKIVVARHFGGGSGLLENEVLAILNTNNHGK